MKEASQIGDIIIPHSIAFSFDAPGWKVLGISVALILLSIGWWMYRQHRKSQYRRDALNLLKKDAITAIEIDHILRRVANTAYLKEDPAALYGKNWYQFLDQKTKQPIPHRDETEKFEKLIYGNTVNSTDERGIQNFIEFARFWVRKHAV